MCARCNVAAVRKEKRNGPDVVNRPSATLPATINDMNFDQVSAAEIAKVLHDPEPDPGTVSANPGQWQVRFGPRDPEGIRRLYRGMERKRAQEGGRVLLDKVIDVEVAKSTQNGKGRADAIDKGERPHVHKVLSVRAWRRQRFGITKHTATKTSSLTTTLSLDQTRRRGTPDRASACWSTPRASRRNRVNSIGSERGGIVIWTGRWIQPSGPLEKRQQRAPIMERLKTALNRSLCRCRAETLYQTRRRRHDCSKEQFDALSEGGQDPLDGIGKTKLARPSRNGSSRCGQFWKLSRMPRRQRTRRLSGLVAKNRQGQHSLDEESAKERPSMRRASSLRRPSGQGRCAQRRIHQGMTAMTKFADMDLKRWHGGQVTMAGNVI